MDATKEGVRKVVETALGLPEEQRAQIQAGKPNPATAQARGQEIAEGLRSVVEGFKL